MTEPPHLPEHVRALIAAEDAAPAGGDRAAVRARVLASVGAGVVAAASSTGTAAAAGTAAAPAAGATAGSAAALGLAGKLAIVALVAGAIGGGAALLAGRGDRSTAPRHASTSMDDSAIIATPSPTLAAPSPAVVTPPSARVAAPSPAVVAPSASAALPPRSALASPPASAPPSRRATAAPPVDDQPTLLHRAWQSLARGDAAAALATVDVDARLHPAGALTEEREALRLDALLRLSRAAEARERARAFAARYPDSIHRDLVTRALGESR